MTWIIAAVLMQAPTLEDRVDAFLRGDAGARETLLKLGTQAIRPLQKSRDKAPEKIDAFVYDLKKAAMFPKDSDVWKSLEERVTVAETVVLIEFDEACPDVKFGALRGQIPASLYIQKFTAAEVKSTKTVIRIADRPAREILDQFCLQTGLDYAFFHHAVVVGHPDRLWPAGPPAPPRPLTPAEEKRALEWIGKLGEEKFAVREEATRELMKLGPSVTPILEKGLDRKDAEVAARCKFMIENLNRPARSPFGPAAALEQKLTGDDEAVLEALKRGHHPTVRLKGVDVSSIAEILLGSQEIRFTFPVGGDKPVIPHVDINDLGTFDVMSMVTQMAGLDFIIKNGEMVIDSRKTK